MDYSGMRVEELRAQLEKRGLTTTGKKAELLERLDNFDSSRTLQAATEAGEGADLGNGVETNGTDAAASGSVDGDATVAEGEEAATEAEPMTDDVPAEDAGEAKEEGDDSMKDDAAAPAETTATPANTPAKPKQSRKRLREEVIPEGPTVFFLKMSPLAADVVEQDIIDAFKAEPYGLEVKEVSLKRMEKKAAVAEDAKKTEEDKKPEEEAKAEGEEPAADAETTAETPAEEAEGEKSGEAGDEAADTEMADADGDKKATEATETAAKKDTKKERAPWALVAFGSEEDRAKALAFDGEIKGHKFDSITEFYRHKDKIILFVANVPQPRDMSDADLKKRFAEILGDEPPLPLIRRKLRKNFCFITFQCLRDAKAARAKLEVAAITVKDGADASDNLMRVEYSTPENKRPHATNRGGAVSQTTAQEFSRTIYIRNIPVECTDDELMAHFTSISEKDAIESLNVPRKNDSSNNTRRYGFLRFKKASSAMRVVEEHAESPFKEEVLELSIADANQSNTRGGGARGRGGRGGRGRGAGGRGARGNFRGSWGPPGPSPRGRRGRGGRSGGGYVAPPPSWSYDAGYEEDWGSEYDYGYGAPPPAAAYGYGSPSPRARGRGRRASWGASPRGGAEWGTPSPRRGRARGGAAAWGGAPRGRGGRGTPSPRGAARAHGWGAGASPRGRGRGRGRAPAAHPSPAGQGAGGVTMAYDRHTQRYVPLSQEQVQAAIHDPYYGY